MHGQSSCMAWWEVSQDVPQSKMCDGYDGKRPAQSPIRCGFWSEVAGRRLLWRAFPGRRRWMVEEGRFPGRNSVAEVMGRRGWRRRL